MRAKSKTATGLGSTTSLQLLWIDSNWSLIVSASVKTAMTVSLVYRYFFEYY